MRRNVLRAAAGALLLLTLLCGAGTAWAWRMQGRALVLPGASDVRIERGGAFRLHVTYQLPRGQTLYDLRRHLMRQGWRLIRLSNADRTSASFVRSGWADQAREILVVRLDAPDRRLADLLVSPCFRIQAWVECL